MELIALLVLKLVLVAVQILLVTHALMDIGLIRVLALLAPYNVKLVIQVQNVNHAKQDIGLMQLLVINVLKAVLLV